MKKLNIAIICDSATSFIAGAFISTLRFSELLSKKGHKVILISSKKRKEPPIDYYKNIKIYRFPSLPVPKSKKRLYFAIPLKRKIKKILKKEEIDIVHIMIPTPLAISTISVAKKIGIKIVSHSHTQPENWEPYFPWIIRKKISKMAYKYITRVYNKSDIIICPSKFAEKIIKKNGVKINTKVISNGVDTSKFKKTRAYNKYLKKFDRSKNSRKLLFVGRLDPEKNIEVLIKSIPYIEKEFKNFEVYIVGEGILKNKLEYLAKRIGVKNKVRFFGRVSDKEVIALYNISDIFILPSLIELEGIVVLEAMSCGKPILISNSKNSASSYFVKGNGLIFNHKSPKDLAKKCLILLTNNKLFRKMSQKSYQESRKYDINKSIRELEGVYHSLLR